MTQVKLKNIDRFKDRQGRVRYYYRANRGPRIPLPGEPGSPEFMQAYERAARQEPPPPPVRKERGAASTFARLSQDYYSSPDYLRMTESTRHSYRRVIDRLLLAENIAHRLVSEMKRDHVKRIVAKRSATPGAANDVLKKLRILLNFAIDQGLRSDNPASRIKKFAGGEFHTWTDDEIAGFERRWEVGSTGRLAFALLLYTGQRRPDVVKMSDDDIQNGLIRVVQRKTGAKLWIPVHPALVEALAARETTGGAILRTAYGKPYTSNGFGNYMAERIAEAGLPDRCVTHGLRKAAARRLAEAGCSANEIASITGHATLAEVTRYTKAAGQTHLARSAMVRLTAVPNPIQIPKLPEAFGNSAEKPNEINEKRKDGAPYGSRTRLSRMKISRPNR